MTRFTVYKFKTDEESCDFFLTKITTVQADNRMGALAKVADTKDRWFRRSDYRVFEAGEKRTLRGWLREDSKSFKQAWEDVREAERAETL